MHDQPATVVGWAGDSSDRRRSIWDDEDTPCGTHTRLLEPHERDEDLTLRRARPKRRRYPIGSSKTRANLQCDDGGGLHTSTGQYCVA